MSLLTLMKKTAVDAEKVLESNMREIVKPNGEVYALVEVQDGLLQITPKQGTGKDTTLILDAKIIPQLRQILNEADFFKNV